LIKKRKFNKNIAKNKKIAKINANSKKSIQNKK